MWSEGLGTENDCAGEDPPAIVNDRPILSSGCYIRTMKASIRLKKQLLIVILKGLVAKTN
jgi:hypothetical protein